MSERLQEAQSQLLEQQVIQDSLRQIIEENEQQVCVCVTLVTPINAIPHFRLLDRLPELSDSRFAAEVGNC